MELLGKNRTSDVLAYVVAYILLVVTVLTAWAAMIQLRLSVFLVGGSATQDGRWMRLLNMISWVILVIAVAVYALVVEHAYRDAVTRARVRSARAHPGVAEPRSGVLRFLRRFNLDMLGAMFARFFTGTVVAFALLFGLRQVLVLLLPG